jgi:hypothetical protein
MQVEGGGEGTPTFAGSFSFFEGGDIGQDPFLHALS